MVPDSCKTIVVERGRGRGRPLKKDWKDAYFYAEIETWKVFFWGGDF